MAVTAKTFFGWLNSEMSANKNYEHEVVGEGGGLSKGTCNINNIMRLSWALVHSRCLADVKIGITMLEG